MSIQLTQLEDDHTKLELQSSAALLSSQSELAAVKMQLQQSQDAGAAMSQSLAALQEQTRQSNALLAAAESRVQSMTLQVTQLEEQKHQTMQNLEAAQDKLLAIDQQLCDAQDHSRATSQAASKALETQSASHLLSQAQQRDAVLEANARCGQLAAQLGACEQRLQTAITRAAAAETRVEEMTTETSHQLEEQQKALDAVCAAQKRQHEAAIAAVEHRCERLGRALEESEANARAAEARAVQAESAVEAAVDAQQQHERGLQTAAETWQERQ